MHWLAIWLTIFSVLGMLFTAPVASAQPEDRWTELSTPHFRVEAVNDHAAQASWYAGFVEQVHDELSDLLFVSLDRTIRVRLFPTEEAYVAANPAAAGARGILAHAHPSGDEIGLALVRLEALPGPSRVAAFRHELAHMLLDIRSDRRLPIGFQEGIAQYVEQDPSTDADTLEGLRRAFVAGRLLSWSDLHRPALFLQQADVAYPESHAIVAYLIERHGLGPLGRLLDSLRERQELSQALYAAYGLSSDALEEDWRAAVPAVVTSGLPRNVLGDGSLRPAQQAAAEQRWADSAGLARVAEQFWTQIGHSQHAAEARALADLADSVAISQRAHDEAQRRLDEGQYREAIDIATKGLGSLPARADQAYRAQLQSIVQRAEAGLQGRESLASANDLMASYRIIDAQRLARLAEQHLTLAGDDARAAEARDLGVRAQQVQQAVGTGALFIALLSGGAYWLGRIRSTPTVTIPSHKREVQL